MPSFSRKPIMIQPEQIRLVLFLLALPALSPEAMAEDTTENLLDMSLEQLTNVEVAVSGTLTETNPHKAPVTTTTITSEQIAVTPARNLMDIIEIYVPGAMWLSYSTGPLLAMRGMVAERNYKYLVIVNGVNVNENVLYGALSELSMWDLSDIEKVEVIRGPGSVTYGPGAIAGVINITLKNAFTAPGLGFGASYWDKYMSKTAWTSYGQKGKEKEPAVFGYYSITSSDGISPDVYATSVTRIRTTSPTRNTWHSDAGYVGNPGSPKDTDPPMSYLDSGDDQQIKGLADIDFKNGWRFWTRYTQGQVPTNTAATQSNYSLDPTFRDFRYLRERQYIASIEKKEKLNSDFSLQTTLSYVSTDVKRVNNEPTAANHSQYSLKNANTWFSESKYQTRLQLNYDPCDFWKGAFGVEYAYDVVGPGWGRNRNDGLRIDTTMISGQSSNAYGPGTSYMVNESTPGYMAIQDGWATNSYAFFGEANFELNDKWTALLSARMDKQQYTDNMFSPRASLINEFMPNHFLRFTAQRSVRMNTEAELYRMDKNNENIEPEKLDTYEMAYHAYLRDGLNFKVIGFYNDLQAIAVDLDSGRVQPIGTHKTAGVSLETSLERETFDLGLNHSFVKQLSWDMASGVNGTGVSYSDYNYSFTDYVQGTPMPTSYTGYTATYRGTGNDISNYSNQMTKFFGNWKLFDKKVTLHGDMRVFWGFEGGRDGLDMQSHATRSDGSTGVNSQNIHAMNEHGVFDPQAMGNVSITYHLSKSSSISLFVQNIPIFGDNKRYVYSTGERNIAVNQASPNNVKTGKVCWIEEPTVVGVKFAARF